MKTLLVFLGVILLAFGQGQIAQADSLTILIGDKDNLGGKATTNHFTHGDWDTRSAAESAATNGAQYTDYAEQYYGTYFYTIDFIFDYDAFASIDTVSLTIGAGGIQTNDTDPNTSNNFEDGLLIDSVVVPDAFNGVEQEYSGFGLGFGILNWTIDNSFFSYFMDGSATVTVALNSWAGTSLPGTSEPAVFDFAELTVNGELQNGSPVPEPATMLLLGSGLVGLAGFRRKMIKKRQ